MKISWFNNLQKDGNASFYASHLTLNAVSKAPFEHVEYARVGIDEKKRLVLCPVDKDTYDNPLTDKSECYPISTHSSYARISSTLLLRQIGEAYGLTFTSSPYHAKTTYDAERKYLIIDLGKES